MDDPVGIGRTTKKIKNGSTNVIPNIFGSSSVEKQKQFGPRPATYLYRGRHLSEVHAEIQPQLLAYAQAAVWFAAGYCCCCCCCCSGGSAIDDAPPPPMAGRVLMLTSCAAATAHKQCMSPLDTSSGAGQFWLKLCDSASTAAWVCRWII